MAVKHVKTSAMLYKASNNGKISEWQVRVYDDTVPFYEITFGYQDGAKQVKRVEVPEGKNIGRANETSALTQCLLEADSKFIKQRDRKGYSTTVPSSTDGRNLLPMLAKSYDDQKKNLVYPCYAQPKLDGIRCLAYWDIITEKVVMISRQGKEFKALGHLEKQLFQFLKDTSLILDGELYVHGETFQDIVSAIKRDEPSPVSHLIEYHVYDIVDTESDYVARNYQIETKVKKQLGGTNVKVVPTWVVNSEAEIDTMWSKATDDGYEGIMLRNKLGFYKCDGRSSDLLKYKKFMDEEFEIVDAYENKKQPGQCSLVCRTKQGFEFGVKPEGSAEQREQIWQDFNKGQLTGKFLTVRFFAWTTSKNPVPRFPIGVSIRDYE